MTNHEYGAGVANVHFMSQGHEWSTPQWLFDRLDAEFGFTLDPCATPSNAKCRKYFTIKEDGLGQDWGANIVFMNPPYGKAISLWMRKAYESARRGATTVCLVPARTDTNWWHSFAMKGQIRFLKGRLRFGGASNAAPFPSAVVIFRPVHVCSTSTSLRTDCTQSFLSSNSVDIQHEAKIRTGSDFEKGFPYAQTRTAREAAGAEPKARSFDSKST